MSYSLKYWNEFKNYYDETVRIEILGNLFTGVAEEVKTSSTPLIISYPGTEDSYNPIIGSQAKIKLLSETNFQFIDLHNSSYRAHRVDIYKESVLDWTGWILPDLFSEPYVAPPYFVEVTARCGLGELKELYVPDSINELVGTLVSTTQPTLYSIIATALLSLNNVTTLNSAVNLFYDSNDYKPLPYTKINLSAYEGLTYYEAITDILLTLGARLYQMGSEWWLVRVKELGDELTYEKYTMDVLGGNTSTTETGKLTTFLIGRPQGHQIVNSSPQLDINPAWKQFTWVQDLGLKDSFIRNNTFDEWTDGALDYWELPLGGTATQWQGSDFKYAEITTLNKLAARKELKQSLGYVNSYPVPYAGKHTLLFNLIFDLYVKQVVDLDKIAVASTIFLKSIVSIFDGVDTWYLEQSPDPQGNSLSWTTTKTEFQITVYGTDVPGVLNFKTASFTADRFPVSGELSISLFTGLSTFFGAETLEMTTALKEVSCTILNNDGEDYINEYETQINVNQENIYTPSDIAIVGGDLPSYINLVEPNKDFIWFNGYRDSDGLPTENWHESGSTTEKPLLELIGSDYKLIYNKPQFKLSLPILSQSIQFDSCIVDYQVLPKKYICTGGDIDYQTCIFSGTFIEFALWESAPWILETGFWNDEGIWIDTETWKDGSTDVIEIDIDGGVWEDISSNFEDADIITTLPPDIVGIRLSLREGGVTITSLPHTLTGGMVEAKSDAFAVSSYSVSFKIERLSVEKTVIINVNL